MNRPTARTSCLVLAGGTGARLGGVDKALIDIDGRPMIELLLESVADFVDDIVISANQNTATLARYGLVVEDDAAFRGAGPLAGLYSTLSACEHEHVLVCCCDMPMIPPALLTALLDGPAHRLCVCTVDSRTQLLMSLHRDLAASMRSALQNGDRSMMSWIRSQQALEIPWQADGCNLMNINTDADLASLRQALSAG